MAVDCQFRGPPQRGKQKFTETVCTWGTAFAAARCVSSTPDISIRLTVQIRGEPYYLTISPESFKLVAKGKREGIELPWSAFATEDAQMLSALHAAMRRGRPKN